MLHLAAQNDHPIPQPTNPALALFDREVRRLSAERAALSAQLVILVESAQRMVGEGTVSLVPIDADDHHRHHRGMSMLDQLRVDGVLTLTMGAHGSTPPPPPTNENIAPTHSTSTPTVAHPDVTTKPAVPHQQHHQGVIKMTSTRPAVVQTLHRVVSRSPKAELSPTKPTPPVQQTTPTPTPTTSRTQGIVLLPARDLRRSTSRAATPEAADQHPSPPPTPTNAPQPQPKLPLHPTTSNTSNVNNNQRRPSQAPLLNSQPSSRGSSSARELRTFDVEDSKPVIEAPLRGGIFPDDGDEDTLHLYGRPAGRAIRFGEAPATRSSQQPTPRTSRPSSRAASPSPAAAASSDDVQHQGEVEKEVPPPVSAVSVSHNTTTTSRTASPFIACRSRASSEEAPYNNPSAASSSGGLVVVRRQSSPVRQPPPPTPAVAAGREWMFPTSAGRPRLT